jgi:chemotaxis protein histidine kinase CheA
MGGEVAPALRTVPADPDADVRIFAVNILLLGTRTVSTAWSSLNALLGISAIPRSNSDDELAVLLVQAGNAELGLLVDGFQETMGVIQKPFSGFLTGLSAYSGSALMGDGSVLMILNIREIV